MATKDFKIDVERRDGRGKKASRDLRATGFIPGIYYASDQPEPIAFQVNAKLLGQALASDALVYHVSVGGERRNVLIKELQYHPVTDEILHVDLKGVRMDELVEVRVPIHIVGVAPGVKDEGGQMHHDLQELDIRCRASDIPTHFDIDISARALGESIHASDIELGEVEMLTPADVLVVNIAHPKGPEEEEVLEEEEGFEFEEGEGEEGAEEGESGDEPGSEE